LRTNAAARPADEPLAGPADGVLRHAQRLDDLPVGPARPAVGLVGQQQDAGVGQLARRRLARVDQPAQLHALLGVNVTRYFFSTATPCRKVRQNTHITNDGLLGLI